MRFRLSVNLLGDPALTPEEFARRIFAVTLLLLATGVFGLSVVNPLYVHLSDIRGNIDQERMLLGRLNAIVGDQTGANDIEKLSKAEEDSSLFLQGESEAIKLASLQSRLSEIVSANGVKLRSARNLPFGSRAPRAVPSRAHRRGRA